MVIVDVVEFYCLSVTGWYEKFPTCGYFQNVAMSLKQRSAIGNNRPGLPKLILVAYPGFVVLELQLSAFFFLFLVSLFFFAVRFVSNFPYHLLIV